MHSLHSPFGLKASFLVFLLSITSVSADGATGKAEGFAAAVTGGGSADPVTPTTTDELVSYLGDSEARVILITKTFDFTGTEGTKTESGCAPWGTGAGCQLAINANDWCSSSSTKVSVTYDAAGTEGITVGSNKSIVGKGSAGVIRGKGLYIKNAKNVIVQNVHITDLNPKYVWGGDAISLAGTDLVWIDHCKTSLIGRQHIVLGTAASGRVSITNNEIDGQGNYSAACNGEQYWNVFLAGSNDQVTLKGNYIHDTAGRAPKVGYDTGNTLLHAVNNYWLTNKGHAFEIETGAKVLAEGNVFEDIDTVMESNPKGKYFTSPDSSTNAQCKSGLGHTCEANLYTSSGTWDGTDTDILSEFGTYTVADAAAASTVKESVMASAGVGKIVG